MKINTPLFDILSQFNSNWEQYQPRLRLELTEIEVSNVATHPLMGELTNLINGNGASLPFFTENAAIIWCTLAPDSTQLQHVVSALQSWILPSYGYQGSDDGYKSANLSSTPFQQAISTISPGNYFRWRSTLEQYSSIEHKLAIRFQLEKKRPVRTRKKRPSLYELRTQFQTALTLGDRTLAEKAIVLIDTYELDKALNTQMMRIRFWHHFREFDSIRTFPNLNSLRSLKFIPNIISSYIKEALGETTPEPILTPKKDPKVQPAKENEKDDWDQWFELILNNDSERAQSWLVDKEECTADCINLEQAQSYTNHWDTIYVDDVLCQSNNPLIREALIVFLGDFVREPEFPRTSFSELYLSLLRLWTKMNAGIGTGKAEGHVLLELACALFELNHGIDEAKSLVEDWWEARPVSSQLSFALNAIELLSAHHPDQEAAGNLWVAASDIAKRNSLQLLSSEQSLWRSVGITIGFEKDTIEDYFPLEKTADTIDILTDSNLKKIAIVCMREQQATEAAKMIEQRTNATVSIVSGKTAGKDTDKACSCDVILFVWMATSHAVFRAFDHLPDRNALCYVQGTGASSIVRSLERWVRDVRPKE